MTEQNDEKELAGAVQLVRHDKAEQGLELGRAVQPAQAGALSPPATLPPEPACTRFLTPDAMMPMVASHEYVQQFMGPNFQIEKLFAALTETVVQSKNGDLSNLEAMLVSQASAFANMTFAWGWS